MTSLRRTLFQLEVLETSHHRRYWASRPSISDSTANSIRLADVILAPWESRGGNIDTFPTGTKDIFLALRTALGADRVTIAVERENYVELALHADELRWPAMIINTLFLGTLAAVLAAQIDHALNAPSPPTTLELSLTLENQSGKCIAIEYKGPPSRAIDAILQEATHCFPEMQRDNIPVETKDGERKKPTRHE